MAGWEIAGMIPSVGDALRRLARLEADGPSPEAFTFKQPFAVPSGSSPVA